MRRVPHGAAGGDDVLDQGDPAAGHVGALGELAGAVLLGLLADEQRRQPGPGAEHRDDRDAAELEAAEQVGVRRAAGPTICAATRASRAGSVSKRYLSKYSRDTCPERSVNSPVRRQQASTSAASEVGIEVSRWQTLTTAGTARYAREAMPARTAARLDGIPPTIFSTMSALAVRTGAVNLGQGFPDVDGPPEVIAAAVAALRVRRQPVRPRHRHPGAAAGDRAAPATPLRHRARPRHRGRRHDRRHRGDRGRPAGVGEPRRRGGGARAVLRLVCRCVARRNHCSSTFCSASSSPCSSSTSHPSRWVAARGGRSANVETDAAKIVGRTAVGAGLQLRLSCWWAATGVAPDGHGQRRLRETDHGQADRARAPGPGGRAPRLPRSATRRSRTSSPSRR